MLAIGGLIFLMVFIALPALQGGQRDGARKSDASTILSQVNVYISGNSGKFPTAQQLTGSAPVAGFSAPGAFVKDVSTNTDKVGVGTKGAASVKVSAGQAVVVQASKCGSTGVAGSDGSATQALTAGTTNQYTVTTFLEGGGGVSYCVQS